MKKTFQMICIVLGLFLILNTYPYLSMDIHKVIAKGDSVRINNVNVIYSIAQDSENYEGPFYTRQHIYIKLHVGTHSIGNRYVYIDEVSLDYDESKLIIIDKYAGISDTPGTLEGYDDGDRITWRNIVLREIPSSDSGIMDAPTDFTAQVTALIDENVPGGDIIESTMYLTFDGGIRKTSTRCTVTSGDFNLGGLNIEKRVKKADDDSAWRNTISAKVGDRLKMQINLSNIGVPINDSYFIWIRYMYDFLPSGLRYIEGSGKLTATFPKYELRNITLPGGKEIQLQVRNGTENKTINLEPDLIKTISGGRTLLGWYLTDIRGPIQGNGTEYLTKDEIPTVFEYEVDVVESGDFINTVAANAQYVRWKTREIDGVGSNYGLAAASSVIPVSARALLTITNDSGGDENNPTNGDENNTNPPDDNNTTNPPSGNDDNNPSIGELPVVQILKPRASYVYLRDKELLKIKRDVPVIIGPINITVNASDPDGSIAKVEFYIDDELKHNATDAPYYYYWNEKTIGIRTLRVRVYDNDDNFAEDTIDVLVINIRKE